MEARAQQKIPRGADWLYEPKWDGFRCIAFRDGADVVLQSKSGQPLERYFPEVVAAVLALPAKRFVIDGEIAIASDEGLDFDALLQRIHPAASRVQKLLKRRRPHTSSSTCCPKVKRQATQSRSRTGGGFLQVFAQKNFSDKKNVLLSPASPEIAQAEQWLAGGTQWFDGVIAKRLDAPYAFGKRDAVVKIKRANSVDCVVGGFRLSKDGSTIGSLLLGLYDREGLLHLVGFVGSLSAAERKRANEKLRPIVQEPGFTGARPGGPSRWSSGSAEWFPVKPSIVVEVQYDHVTGKRFRHGARFLRWRPDKAPAQCRMDEVF